MTRDEIKVPVLKLPLQIRELAHKSDRNNKEQWSAQQLANVVIRGIHAGHVVEIDGLGIFYPDDKSGLRFEPCRQPQVFIAYVTENAKEAAKLADALEDQGFSVWMDVRKLLPGQNWPRAIENAIETADFFVPCYSAVSSRKRGGFQAEIHFALDCARHIPIDDTFIAPVRIDNCQVPRSIQRQVQYVDLFPDWQVGIDRLVQMLRRGRGWRNWE